MSTDDIKPAAPMNPYVGNKQDPKGKRSGYGGSEGNKQFPSPMLKSEAHDITSFMGIPQEELTPAVTEAIVTLMEDLDDLRAQLSHTHDLEHMLSDNLDMHADLPVLTRHALGREILIMCAHVGRSETHSSFVYFQIRNSAQIKARSGLLAYEAVLKEVAVILSGQLRETDRIGTLGGDGFGILLALSDLEKSKEKIEQLSSRVKAGPMVIDGHFIDVEVAYGICALHADQSVESVLKAADTDLHKRYVET